MARASFNSLSRRHPDILHLRRLMQKLVAFALLTGYPIARQAANVPNLLREADHGPQIMLDFGE